MPAWMIYSISFVLMVGSTGVTIKLALRDVSWPVLLIPTLGMYVLLVALFAAKGMMRVDGSALTAVPWIALTGIFTAVSFAFLVLALQQADASRVVPITAAYPVVTTVLSVLVLSESVTAARVGGTLLVVAGTILIAR